MINKIVLSGLAISFMFLVSLACSGENDVSNSVSEGNGADKMTIEKPDENVSSDKMNIKIGEKVLTVSLADNSSVDALKASLAKAPITVEMRDYGNMEKVGTLGQDFPTNDESITTEAGDVILFRGSALVIYYAPNSWNFTRLGKIDNVSAEELKAILGEGNVTVTLTLPDN